MRVLPDGALAAKDTLRTGPSISDEMVPSIVAEDGIALRVYCWLAGESGIFALADGRPVALVLLGDSWSSAKCCGGFRQFTLAGRMA